jgi:hypothetical protein
VGASDEESGQPGPKADANPEAHGVLPLALT